jgi:hypothetical protein
MPKMCELQTSAKGDPVYVNPMTVRYVRPGSPGNAVIHFDGEKSMVVAMDVADVIRALDAALNVDEA